jgi:hypothetical protein
MPITYAIDRDAKLITETWAGQIRRDDVAEYWRRFLSDPEVMEIRCTLADLRQAEFCITGAELDALVRGIIIPALDGRDWRTALVVGGPVQFGVSRQYQVFAERFSRNAIFRSIEEARAWLGLPDSGEKGGSGGRPGGPNASSVSTGQ